VKDHTLIEVQEKHEKELGEILLEVRRLQEQVGAL
jgi:hypothetical protein